MLPAVAQYLAVLDGQVEQATDTVDVLDANLASGIDLGELGQGRYEDVAHLLDRIVATDTDGVNEAL